MRTCVHKLDPMFCPFKTCAEIRRASKRTKTGDDQYNFVDMTGQVIRGVKVIERRQNTSGGARWYVEFACGHRGVVYGTALRAARSTSDKSLNCKNCNAMRKLKK